MKYDLRKIHDFARNLFIEKVIGLSLTVPIEIENEAQNQKTRTHFPSKQMVIDIARAFGFLKNIIHLLRFLSGEFQV